MADVKVIAYFMHEHEQNAATTAVKNARVTDSYVIGDIDETKVADLQRAGLIVERMRPAPPNPVDPPASEAAALDVLEPTSAQPARERSSRHSCAWAPTNDRTLSTPNGCSGMTAPARPRREGGYQRGTGGR